MARRSPIKWPNDAWIAIVPCVAFETWPEDLGVPGSLNMTMRAPLTKKARFKKDLSVITDRQYGERVGVFRMLDLFEAEGVKTTFFLNGMVAEKLPEITNEIKEKGHEIATESYIHDYSYMKTYEEEREDLQKTKEAIEKTIGVPPKGYLSMGIQPTENTPLIIAEKGYTYWADPQHEEIPYTLKVGDKNLVVLSYNSHINDYTTYPWDAHTPRQLLEIWKDSFDLLYEEGQSGSPKTLMWGLHPFLSGRPFRAKILKEFIRYAKGHPKVWFARCIDIAEWWLKNYKDTHVEKWPNCLRIVEPPMISKASMIE
ncbi:MAG: hypothetical protein A2169_08085 [Deltaproteobacteria bacterium RBG_13_47_9]|nr:MAG: hypothetical protein A2169_08085 [Deltaproteobacteria bacterium RBG_13_47_9]